MDGEAASPDRPHRRDEDATTAQPLEAESRELVLYAAAPLANAAKRSLLGDLKCGLEEEFDLYEQEVLFNHAV